MMNWLNGSTAHHRL